MLTHQQQCLYIQCLYVQSERHKLRNLNEALFISPCYEERIFNMGENPNAFYKVRTTLRSTVNSNIAANSSKCRRY
jgi:uncharacterized protein (DUF1786 family)